VWSQAQSGLEQAGHVISFTPSCADHETMYETVCTLH
jgi:hypothetical protein